MIHGKFEAKWCITAWSAAQCKRIALASSALSLSELLLERTLASGHRPGGLGAEEAIGWIGVLQCIHPLLEIVFCNWDSVRVGGPALDVAAVGMRMQTDRESKRVRLDGWGLHEDPAANAESSGYENGAHDGKPGKDEEVDWEKGGRNSLGSVSVPVSGFDTITWMPLRSSC